MKSISSTDMPCIGIMIQEPEEYIEQILLHAMLIAWTCSYSVPAGQLTRFEMMQQAGAGSSKHQ